MGTIDKYDYGMSPNEDWTMIYQEWVVLGLSRNLILIHSLETMIYENDLQVNQINYGYCLSPLFLLMMEVVHVNQGYSLILILAINCIIMSNNSNFKLNDK